MSYLFTSESVSQGHPDKVADQISDVLVDNFIAFDDKSHCAIETAVTTGQVFVFGEVASESNVDVNRVIREKINKIGYTKDEYQFSGNSCGILNSIHEQSADIARGVNREEEMEQGAGDQGIMFGYATNETENYIPATLDIAHAIVKELALIREEKNANAMEYLRPDSKSQVTIQYSENHVPEKITTIVVSTQHDEFASDETMATRIRHDVINYVIPRVKRRFSSDIQKLFNDDIEYFVNPTGKFVIGGPHGDSGLTSRKLIVDTYGGRGSFGGGGYSGKCPSKVDRSAAYMTRYIAKNAVAAGIADKMSIQIGYAIGIAKPMSFYVDTYGSAKVQMSDSEIAKRLEEMFDLRPRAIEIALKLRNPMYEESASYGHMGRTPKVVHKVFKDKMGNTKEMDVELFTWEKLDKVEEIRKKFGLSEN